MKALGTQSRLSGMTCVPMNPLDRTHLIDLADLDEAASPDPWTASKFRQELTNPLMEAHGVIGPDRSLIASAIVRNGDLSATLIELVVRPEYRRIGVGKMLVNCLRKTCLTKSRMCLEAVVGDDKKETHFFLKAAGFLAVEMIPSGAHHVYVFRLFKTTGDSK